jgi:hypothetical protein
VTKLIANGSREGRYSAVHPEFQEIRRRAADLRARIAELTD